MQLRFQEFDDFIVFFKPNGIRMHQVNEGQYGFVEVLSEQLKMPLYLVQRLDKQTSGLTIIAKSKESAAKLSELFETQQVKKTYFFLTNKKGKASEYTISTHIEKKQNQFVNNPSLPANSETHLQFIKSMGTFHLWKASPKTGKPHQIRLHAEQYGISILGDSEHHGDSWFRLSLHAGALEFQWNEKQYLFECPLPPSFLAPASPEMVSLFSDHLFNKKQLFNFTPNEAFRLINLESAFIRADIFGSKLWVYDYSLKGLALKDIEAIQAFAKINNYELIIRYMLDRGHGVGGLEKSTLLTAPSVSSWTAHEENISYEFRTDAGFSAGLFLDQRENRKRIKEHSAQKSVLNLFCYTSGFSVVAALGRAKQVTSVDVSKKILEWAKENFKLNKIDIKNHEFFAQDVLLFLKGSVKRNRKWDLIICDPPSFGRSQDAVWKIEKNIAELAELMWNCLSDKGEIFFTCNYADWSRTELIKQFCKKLPPEKLRIKRLPFLSLDFGETDDSQNLMKGFVLQKVGN